MRIRTTRVSIATIPVSSNNEEEKKPTREKKKCRILEILCHILEEEDLPHPPPPYTET